MRLARSCQSPAFTPPWLSATIARMKATKLSAHPIQPRPGMGIRKNAHAMKSRVHAARPAVVIFAPDTDVSISFMRSP